MYKLKIDEDRDGKKKIVVTGDGDQWFDASVYKAYIGDEKRKFDVDDPHDFQKLHRFLVACHGIVPGSRVFLKTYAEIKGKDYVDEFRWKVKESIEKSEGVIEIKNGRFSFLIGETEYDAINGKLDLINSEITRRGISALIESEKKDTLQFNIVLNRGFINVEEMNTVREIIAEVTGVKMEVSREANGVINEANSSVSMYAAKCADMAVNRHGKGFYKGIEISDGFIGRVLEKINKKGLTVIDGIERYKKRGMEKRAEIVDFALNFYNKCKNYGASLLGSLLGKREKDLSGRNAENENMGGKDPLQKVADNENMEKENGNRAKGDGRNFDALKNEVNSFFTDMDDPFEIPESIRAIRAEETNKRAAVEGEKTTENHKSNTEPERNKMKDVLVRILESEGYDLNINPINMKNEAARLNVIYVKRGECKIDDMFYLLSKYGDQIKEGSVSFNSANRLMEVLEQAMKNNGRVEIVMMDGSEGMERILEAVCVVHTPEDYRKNITITMTNSREKIRHIVGVMNELNAQVLPQMPNSSLTI